MTRNTFRVAAGLILVGMAWLGWNADLLGRGGGGRGGGGGARAARRRRTASMGGHGGGGARPAAGAPRPASRPSASASRPSLSGAAGRPASRPGSPAQRPSMGPSPRPGSGKHRRPPGSVSRPSSPGVASRPGAGGPSVAHDPPCPAPGQRAPASPTGRARCRQTGPASAASPVAVEADRALATWRVRSPEAWPAVPRLIFCAVVVGVLPSCPPQVSARRRHR